MNNKIVTTREIADTHAGSGSSRSTSISTLSTIPSSAAEAILKRRLKELNAKRRSNLLQIGDEMIMNFNLNPMSKNAENEFKVTFNPRYQQSSSESPFWGHRKRDLTRKAKKFLQRRKYWIAGVLTIGIIIISLSISLPILFSEGPETPRDNTTTSPDNNIGETPTTESTTTTTVDPNSKWQKIIVNKDRDLSKTKLLLPIERIIVTQTADDIESCSDYNECKLRVETIQNGMTTYNFFVAGDGSIFEGAGINYEGECTKNLNGSSFNKIGICIAFIGTFENVSPSQAQIEGFESFVSHYVDEGKISENHKIFLQDQLIPPKISAELLYEAVENLRYFYPIIKIYQRADWEAAPPRRVDSFDTPVRWIISHTRTATCSSLVRKNSKNCGGIKDLFNILLSPRVVKLFETSKVLTCIQMGGLILGIIF